MEFKPIRLADKNRYEAFYKAQGRMASDASFTTPYAWAASFHTSLCEENGLLCIQGKSKTTGTPYYMMPQGDGDKEGFLKELYTYCHDLSIPFSLHWLLEEDLPVVQKALGNAFSISPARDSAEYIYETEALRTLSGKKLHAKRNHVNAFKAAYAYSYTDITEDTLSDAEDFVLKHCQTDEESLAMRRLFASYFTLGLTGMLLYADGKLAAVTAGEKINKETALIHLEKADTDFTGVYPAVNQLFVENFFADTKYINREEDMGVPGLRKAKLSYRPAFLLEKFTLSEVTT